MWIQAAAVMGGYQDVSATAVAAAPQPAPAPPIMNAAAPAATAAQAAELPPDRQSQFLQWLKDIGYVDLYNKLIKPFVDWLANIPFLQALFSGFDPYLLTLGNPLTYLSPLNIAFALGYPMDFATYVTLLSQTFAFIGADLAAAFASGNPMTIGLTILFTSVEAIGTIITDTIALLKTLLEQTAVLLAALAPMLAAPLVPLAARRPAPPTPWHQAAPAPVDASTLTLTQAPPPPPSTAPPPVSGAGLGVGMENFGYWWVAWARMPRAPHVPAPARRPRGPMVPRCRSSRRPHRSRLARSAAGARRSASSAAALSTWIWNRRRLPTR